MPIPAVLLDPPWRKSSKPAPSSKKPSSSSKPASKKPKIEAKLVWEEGEREQFRGKPPPKMTEAAEEKLFERLLDELDKKAPLRPTELGRLGDEKLEELAGELSGSTTDVATMKLVLGRVGEPFVENAIQIVKAAPRERGLFEGAMPIRSPELARYAAAVFFERPIPASLDEPYARSPAEAWMLRHPEAVTSGLVEIAQDDSNAACKAARAALAFVTAHGTECDDDVPALAEWLSVFVDLAPLARREDAKASWALLLATREDVRAASSLEGEASAKAFLDHARGVKAEKQLAAVPEAVPDLPAIFDAKKLPRVATKDGEKLSVDAVRALGEMLRFSPLANPYVGVAQVLDACDPASLDAFALDLFERWREQGQSDPRDVWILESCGKVGGEKCARTIAERIRSWARGAEAPRHAWDYDSHQMILVSPGSREYAFARTGCVVLAAIDARGVKIAHTLLEDLARGGVQAWLRKEATAALGEEALPHDDVDAPVPDIGLDPDGSATFDTGTRTFTISFDESLTPILVDEEGERVASFPRLKKGEDEQKHAAAKDRYASLVKDGKIVARYQLALLDRMMCTQRTFDAPAFRERFVRHSFLKHFGRRFVWIANDTTFRIAEDGSFADSEDHAFDPGQHPVGVAHPVTMTKALREAWRQRLHDYQIVQPTPQIERETFACGPDQMGAREIASALGTGTSRGRLFNLARRDWKASWRSDVTEYSKELPCGALACFEVQPPVAQGGPTDLVHNITLANCSWTLERLPAIDYSELMRDLEYLKG